jgi:GNAT superfamily N-acetyltransferase
MSDRITIQKAKPEDVAAIHSLIKELAAYEKAPEQVITTVESMLKDGFGPNPAYQAMVAVHSKEGIVGAAVYFAAYSTWRGRILYLDDLIITQRHRKRGIGSMMFKRLAEIALAEGMDQMRWVVLDWNQPAISFYKGINAELDGEWMNGTLRKAQIEKLLES